MPLDLSNTLVIGISATALFDMSASDKSFRETYAHDPDTATAKIAKDLHSLNLNLKRYALLENV